MADRKDFSSAAGPATLPHGLSIAVEQMTIAASTANAEIVMIGASTTGALVSTSAPFPVLLQASTATVTIQGNSTALISTASRIRIESTATLTVDNISTASAIRVESTGTFPVTDNGGSLTIDGNSTAIISTASAIRIKSTSALTVSGSVSIGSGTVSLVGGMGAGSSNPLLTRPYAPAADSTWNSTSITSTTAVTLFSSGGSTRIHLTDIDFSVDSTATGCTLTIYDTDTAGAVLWRAYSGPEGGFVKAFLPPKPAAAGSKIQAQILPASTIHLNAAAYRST